jgi:hypothetical protein
MTPDEALKVARKFVNGPGCHRGFPQTMIEQLAYLLLAQREEAVEEIVAVLPAAFHDSIQPAARVALLVKERQELLESRPEIERAAKVEALRWVLSDAMFFAPDYLKVEAEIKRLEGR